jgi:hypothetical protein
LDEFSKIATAEASPRPAGAHFRIVLKNGNGMERGMERGVHAASASQGPGAGVSLTSV